jgi:hypothetical protein
MIVSRSIDLVLDPDPELGNWSYEGWANALHLLLHRLFMEIKDQFPTGNYDTVLWPGMTISTFETYDALDIPVLRVNATVEVRELDA